MEDSTNLAEINGTLGQKGKVSENNDAAKGFCEELNKSKERP